MNKQRLAIINSFLAFSSLFATYFLWEHSLLLVLVLAALAAAVIRADKDARTLHIFLLGFVFGPIAESIAISGGAWTYTQPDILDIPIWLPFLWGNATLFLLNAERALRIKERR